MYTEIQQNQTDPEKIFSKDHADLKSYLNAVGDWIEKETLRNIPEGDPKEYLYDLMRDYPQRGGKNFVLLLYYSVVNYLGEILKTL